MTKIICPWDMCIYNTACHKKVEFPECTNDAVTLEALGKKDQFMKCNAFHSVLNTEEAG